MHKQRQQRGKRRQAKLPRVGVVQLGPSRAKWTPFCAYYGPKGENCSQTTNLATVFTPPGSPAYTYMACPLHYRAVQQMVQAFLARLASASQ